MKQAIKARVGSSYAEASKSILKVKHIPSSSPYSSTEKSVPKLKFFHSESTFSENENNIKIDTFDSNVNFRSNYFNQEILQTKINIQYALHHNSDPESIITDL